MIPRVSSNAESVRQSSQASARCLSPECCSWTNARLHYPQAAQIHWQDMPSVWSTRTTSRLLAAPARTTYAPQHSAPSAKKQLCRLSPGQIQHSPGSEAASSHKIRSRNGTWTEFASTGNHTVLHSHVFLVRLPWPTWRLSDRQNFGIYDEPGLCIAGKHSYQLYHQGRFYFFGNKKKQEKGACL